MRGRAILADEVGLGKTIEAGLVLSELRLRGLAERALVLTPAGLVEQWRDELERKFSLPTAIVTGRSGVPDCRGGGPVLLASLAAARRDPLKGELTRGGWDLVVADEAHRLRSAHSASGKLIRTLTARFLLLLTATPVENRLQDLYEMISLVAPGLLGTPAQFRTRYAGWRRPRQPAQPGRTARQDPKGDGAPPPQRGGVATAATARRDGARPSGRRRASFLRGVGRADPVSRERRDACARHGTAFGDPTGGLDARRGRPDAGQARLGRSGRPGRGDHRHGQGSPSGAPNWASTRPRARKSWCSRLSERHWTRWRNRCGPRESTRPSTTADCLVRRRSG